MGAPSAGALRPGVGGAPAEQVRCQGVEGLGRPSEHAGAFLPRAAPVSRVVPIGVQRAQECGLPGIGNYTKSHMIESQIVRVGKWPSEGKLSPKPSFFEEEREVPGVPRLLGAPQRALGI